MNGVRGIARSALKLQLIQSNFRCNIQQLASSAENSGASYSKWPNTATATAAVAAAALATGYFGSSALAQSPNQDPHLSISKPPDVWDRWDQVKSFLFSWKKLTATGGGGGGGGGAEVPLPTDKLACHLSASKNASSHRPIVLVSCGSFNPPTTMHVRMLELARQELFSRGYDVLGAYLSPVNDAYWKRDLAPGRHRVQMCHEATADSDFIMVDAWEVEQQQYTRTLFVLKHIESRLRQLIFFSQPPNSNNSNSSRSSSPSSSSKDKRVSEVQEVKQVATLPQGGLPAGCPPTLMEPRTMLVCGADVVETMADASLWKQDLLETLLNEHGVVCITRDGAGANAAWLLEQPGTLLHQYRDNVIIVQDPVPNEVSSSAVRRELKAGRSVKYLIAPAVEEYIRRHGMYRTKSNNK